MKKAVKNDIENGIKLLAKGVDSLYLYLEYDNAIKWELILKEAERYNFDESFKINGMSFIRMKAWIRLFPTCIKHKQFMFFINRKTAYIKVLSLAFELRGYFETFIDLCKVLDKLSMLRNEKWLDLLKVSRLDVYIDFAYSGDFNLNQFKTRLRKKGIFKSGEFDEAVTYYFGNRSSLLVRLYVKSEEIKKSGKDYLKSHWQKYDCKDSKTWRLEFEFHKLKILEILGFKELSFIDENAVSQLFSYGLNAIQYMVSESNSNSLHKKQLHPIWQKLLSEFNVEYRIHRKEIKKANVDLRFKRARKYVISWLVSKGLKFEQVEKVFIDRFSINRYDFEKAQKRQKAEANYIE